MRNYTKHRKGLRKKRTRKLTGGFIFGLGKKASTSTTAPQEPNVGNIDSHIKKMQDKVKAADEALVAAQQAQQRLQQEQTNTAKCASKVKDVIKQKSASSQTRVSDIKKELDAINDQITKFNAQKKQTETELNNELAKLNVQKKEIDKQFAEANKSLSAVNASAGTEFKKCLENPGNYHLAITNIEPTSGIPTPEAPNQRSRVEEQAAMADIQSPIDMPPPFSSATPFGGKKRRRKSKKHKRKSKKHTKSRRH